MNGFNYFENRECKYYSECHGGAEKNCLFCHCPLYHTDCPGTPEYTKDGIKDCQNCMYPHIAENYDEIMTMLKEINKGKRT